MPTGVVEVVLLAILGVVVIVVWAFVVIGSYPKRPPHDVNSASDGNGGPQAADGETRSEKTVCSECEGPDVLAWPREQNAGQPADVPPPNGAPPRNKTILVADDDPIVLRSLSQRLRHLGYRVHCAVDASQALLDVPKVRPDLAILDLVMPAGNGLIVCEMLGCDRDYADIPIIIHSVFTDESIKRRTRQLKAHYVEKSPRSWAEIKQLVESLLSDKNEASATSAATESVERPRPSIVAAVSEKAAEHGEPAARPDGSAVASDAAAAWEQKPISVLCVDDDPVVRRSIAMRLEPYGISVLGVEGGAQAYDSALTIRPDIILLDLRMPDEQGDRVMTKLKEDMLTRDIPVIVLTMESTAGVRRRMISLGAESVVTKPIHWPELLSSMGLCVELPEKLIRDYGLPGPSAPRRVSGV
jgi:CheY-like chemotaxis protein